MFRSKPVSTGRGRRWALAAVAVLGSLTSLGVSAAPARAGVTVDEQRGSGTVVQATFNRPATVGGEDTHVTDHLRTLIENAEPAANIKIALHSITGYAMKQAIVNEAPGVDGAGTVTVIFDRTKLDTMSTQLRDELRAKGGKFVECGHNPNTANDGGCLSGTASYSRQHAKYVLIDRGWKRSGTINVNGFYWGIVWVGSANVSGNGGWEAWNDAVTSYGDTDLYLSLEKVFDKAAGDNWPYGDFYDNPAGQGYVVGPSTKSNITMWASPDTTSTNDLVVQRLRDITPTRDGTCQIRVMQTLFNDARGADVARELVRLRNDGCWVWVLIDSVDGVASMNSAVKDVLCGNVAIHKRANIHDKAFVIRANYGGTFKSIILTGSHNLTPEALRNNDEILARVGASSGPLYNAYVDHFTQAYNGTDEVTCP